MKKVLLAIGCLVVLLLVALVTLIESFNVDKYRVDITQKLTVEIGRPVKLGGPLKLSLSLQGITLDIENAAIGNPTWASRPDLADIGSFKLGLELLPLFDHRLVISSLSIANADILLETTADNRNNWTLTVPAAPASAAAAVPATGKAEPASPTSIAVKVDHLTVNGSQIALRGAEGKATVFKTDQLTMGAETGGLAVHFKGSLNAAPLSLDARTDASDLTSTAMRPVDFKLAYGALTVAAKGKASLGEKVAEFDTYTIASNTSTIHGAFKAGWNGPRPSLSGTIISEKLDLKDFAASSDTGVSKPPASAAPAPAQSPYLLSTAPLPLSGLKAADAAFKFEVAALPFAATTVRNITGELSLKNGHLLISPFKAALGNGQLAGQVDLDASLAIPKLGFTMKAEAVDISNMLELGGMQAFLTGKIDSDMNLVGTGTSIHDIASTLSGSFNLVGAGGDVVSKTANQISSGLDALLTGGTGSNDAINCMVARFTAANGTVKDNGVLVDTSAATVIAKGGFDLHSETIALNIEAKPKTVDTGGLLPPLHVGGTFKQPSYNVNAGAMAQNVIGMLVGNAPVGDVPNITPAQGVNACVNTLNHPSAYATPNKGGAVQGLAAKASDQINKLSGGQMLKGLFGQ